MKKPKVTNGKVPYGETSLTLFENALKRPRFSATNFNKEFLVKMLTALENGVPHEKVCKRLDICRGTMDVYVRELRKAKEAGYTLEGYLKEGRPLHAAKKVLA